MAGAHTELFVKSPPAENFTFSEGSKGVSLICQSNALASSPSSPAVTGPPVHGGDSVFRSPQTPLAYRVSDTDGGGLH
jgi:hypothetical protein